MAIETYTFALETQPRPERLFARWAGCRRWVWNELLKTVLEPIAKQRAEEKAATGKAVTRYPSAYDLQKMLPALKKQYRWLSHPPSHTLQQAAVDLSLALLRVQDGAGFPWFASIQVERPEPAEPPVHPRADRVVGIDRGVAVFAALSDGTHIAPISPLKAAARTLRVAQRALARKKPGSHNRRKAAQRVQRIYRKVGDIRKDFLHKTSTAIAQNHGVVVLETLDVRHMVASARGTAEQPGNNVRAKAGLNRAILDQGWYTFEQMLTYKLKKLGGQLLHVPAAYTSQRCSRCAHTTPDNRRAQAAFCCVSCGHADNADTNAAKNLRRAGQALMGAPKGEHQPHQRRAHEPSGRRA
jgi:IS605 OrfB family transposase